MIYYKNCEFCAKKFQLRPSQMKRRKCCSEACKARFCGRLSAVKRQQQWNKETPEETAEVKKRAFETFFEKGDENSCWLWKPKKGKPSSDYGYFPFRGTGTRSNRAAWLIYNGEIPKGMYVLHTCDIRNCVNINHLFLGTHDDNMKDMRAKQRNKPRTKLTEEQVIKIRESLATGASMADLARDYNVSFTCIWYINHGKSWTNV